MCVEAVTGTRKKVCDTYASDFLGIVRRFMMRTFQCNDKDRVFVFVIVLVFVGVKVMLELLLID